ncbi:MAG: hypothetical protein CVV25_07095 [Ignavibacteriae bacterium HGW-Ignavibacteriae-4]|jgi:hypothetical protein|nr:MAG: hypothetical protein CVV25_07095 [Ignavibacteriae bacterium HGW-Ignavibacteriae-4]
MITKESLINQLDLLPDSFTIDELIDRLILIEKIEIGLKQSEADDVISEEELNAEIEQWFK